MEILKLDPAIKDYLWGGRKLVEKFNKVSDLDKVAETWEMSILFCPFLIKQNIFPHQNLLLQKNVLLFIRPSV